MEIPRHWRLKEQRYRLVGKVCAQCGAKTFPPREICPNCGSQEAIDFTFNGRGEVYSHTTIYEPPAGFEEFVPYTVALVKLEEGPIVIAQLTDVDQAEVKIGLPVEMVTRKLREVGDERGMIVYGYKFRPTLK